MKQYYIWAVIDAATVPAIDVLHQAHIHARTPQEAWGYFLENLKEQSVEAHIRWKGGCEVSDDEGENDWDVTLPEVRFLKEDELHDDQH